MAKNIKNTIIHGVSGKFGEQIVFRQVNGKTLLCQAPKRGGESSPKQLEQQDKFAKASQYAVNALEDSNLLTDYTLEAKKRKSMSAYNVAVADYLNPPNIELVDTSAYTGSVGDRIKVQAFDDFKVTVVMVQIQAADDSVIEEGTATQQGLEWIYTVKTVNANRAGTKINVKATDLPGNVAEESVEL